MATTSKKTFKCTIVTPFGTFFEEDVYRITLPTEKGQMTILPNHEAFIALAQSGPMQIERDGHTESFKIDQGAVEIRDGGDTTLILEHVERV